MKRIIRTAVLWQYSCAILVKCQTGLYVHFHVIIYLAMLCLWPNRIFSLMAIRLVCKSSLVLVLVQNRLVNKSVHILLQ